MSSKSDTPNDFDSFLSSRLSQNPEEEVFLDSLKGEGFSQNEEANLISEAVEDEKSRTKNVGGRPPKKESEKAKNRVVGYITDSEKAQLEKKRGLVSESKLVSALVRKWIAGEIDI